MKILLGLLVAMAAVAGLAAVGVAGPQPHKAHAGPATGSSSRAQGTLCEVCAKPIAAGRDIALTVKSSRAVHHYRCINCALLASRDRLKGDVTLRARSALRGTPVTWERAGGQWRTAPASARVLSLPETKGDCASLHLVFADDAEYRSYAQQHADAAGHAPLPGTAVERVLVAGRPPLPKQAACPVSGQQVRPTAKTDWTMHNGKVYYFCCANCKPRFVSDAAGYLTGKTPPPHAAGSCGGHGEGGCGGDGGCSGGKTARTPQKTGARPKRA